MPRKLDSYRRKRSAGATPEPFGTGADHRTGLFVVQQHAARNLHYDLRLEIAGALHSWAVPKGPSLDPAVKRLAMEVEDHPLEYGDFEGTIPEGNYGAGAVIVFDRGQWISVGDPDEGLRDGKLLFDLAGYKLRGRWTLFRTKTAENSWILMKKPDAFADADAVLPPESVLSGRTVQDLSSGVDPAERLRAALSEAGRPRRAVDPAKVELMLARAEKVPFSREGWLFELKYDGYRLVAARRDGQPYLRYRGGHDATAVFPEIAVALRTLPYDGLVLDGEVVVLDGTGRPSFQTLQQRVRLRRKPDVDRASVSLPATLFVFDLLACEGFDLRRLPLAERKALLVGIVPPAGPIQLAHHLEREGELMFEEVGRLGFEGVVAKRMDASYRGGRSGDWLKIRADCTNDFAVVGFTPGRGSRAAIGALHLALREPEGWVYAGKVGTGFSDRELDALGQDLEPNRVADPPAVRGRPDGSRHVWVDPSIVVEVRYKEVTGSGQLRHPVFLRRREDRTVEDCQPPPDPDARAEPPAPVRLESPRIVRFSNRDKVFWPEQGLTKGDLIDYYESVADWLLPYLRDRPLVLTRYPDGIHGKNFFQKDAPSFVPDWLRTETMWSEHAQREIRYFVCDNAESLSYLANLGTIPLHLWSSRVSSLQHPDWCILDLDPKQAPLADVVRVARRIHGLCREIGLPCFAKTSGSTGVHVLIPLGNQCTYDESRALAELLARVVVAELPQIATVARSLAARDGRVYVDFLQNGHGKLLVSPFSARPVPQATVSTPLRWPEVTASLELSRFTLRSVPARLRRMRRDPWEGLLDAAPDLAAALEALGSRMEGSAD